MRPRIGKRMGLLCSVNRFQIAKAKTTLEGDDYVARNIVTVLVKPECGHLYTVGPCSDFINLINGSIWVRQAIMLIFNVARTTSLSAIISIKKLI